MDAPQKRPLDPVITSGQVSKRSREESGVPTPTPSQDEKKFDRSIRFLFSAELGLEDVPSDQLGAEDLAKLLQLMSCHEMPSFGTAKMSDQYHQMEHCRTAIRDINGLEDALRDGHNKKSYYSIRSISKCSPVTQSTHLTPYTRGTTFTAAREANGFARNCPIH